MLGFIFWFRHPMPLFPLMGLYILATWPAIASEITGSASVVDGDTLEIHGQRIRLYGVDAPESAQLCEKDERPWRCGQQAALALQDRIGRKAITCEQRDIDRYQRIVAVCRVGGEDLSAWLVSQGWALAYRKYSTDYVDDEARASAARVGIWDSTFDYPWDWREAKRTARQTQPLPTQASSCLIKGNINKNGDRIYHVPGSKDYEKTNITAAKGERWFCTEEEARKAGWREPRG